MTTGGRDMRGAGVVANGEKGRVGEIDQPGKLGPANEIDRRLASCADFGREGLLAPSADNDGESTGCLEQTLGQLAISPGRPALCRMARRRSGDQQEKAAQLQPRRQKSRRCRAGSSSAT